MNNRELVMLGHPYDSDRDHFAGWYLSEKLDGQRAVWLPETRNKPIAEVAFANRALDNRDHICTGLWTRNAKVIHAPESWLNELPQWTSLDGELWLDRGQNQYLQSVITRLRPGPEWSQIKYMVFDIPDAFYVGGRVKNKEYEYVFPSTIIEKQPIFSETVKMLREIPLGKYGQFVDQMILPRSLPEAKDIVEKEMEKVLKLGGEGLMIRSPTSIWYPQRTRSMVKVKPAKDSEAKIIGYLAGKGKLRGLVGAFKVEWNGKVFDLSGFTDKERMLDKEGAEYAYQHPGEIIPIGQCLQFPRGTIVQFKYREETKAGIPKEGRFFRKVVS